MIKKVDVSELRPGMYIHSLNREWMAHPFLRNRFRVQSERDIEKISELGVDCVYIDTERGLDSSTPPCSPKPASSTGDLHALAGALKRTASSVPVQEEIRQAKGIVKEANFIVQTILKDCRLGKQVELEKAQPIVGAIIDSIFRNPDAMVSLLRIKQADLYTYQHSVAVATLLISFCRSLELEQNQIELAGIGGLLHDVGKMMVPGYILNKPGKLSEREFAVMRKHVALGRTILENTVGISPISVKIAAEHHERYNGSGYPLGLKGDQISQFGHMAAIVDFYDALTSRRVYHAGLEPTAVLQQLLEGADRHFAAPLVHSFIRTVGIYPVGTLVKLENDDLAVVVEQHHQDLLHPKVKSIFNCRLRRFIRPKNYDLSKPGCQQRIVHFEIPSRWRIEPMAYL
ncbi:HD-GYP domain-containing protein [Methylomonas sp. MgM2]